jgi:uncharacterized protein involved in exopolysaccharide biosynthesis
MRSGLFQANSTQNGELTLRDLIIKLREWVRYLKSKIVIIVALGFFCGGIGFLYAYKSKPLYIATLTFGLEEEKGGLSGVGGGALGIASSFGIDMGSSSSGIFTGNNILDLMKSRRIIQSALLFPVENNGKIYSLANFYLNLSNNEKSKIINDNTISFAPFSKPENFTRKQDSIMGFLYEKVINTEGLLSVFQKDKKVSIISIQVKSENELFSKYFTEAIADVISEFYISTKSKKAYENYLILQKQVDSIRIELNKSLSSVANINDNTFNLNPGLNNVMRLPSVKKQIDLQANSAILTQLIANLEIAKVTLRRETPLIQVIDTPIIPLPKTTVSKVVSSLSASLIAIFLTILFLICRRLLFLSKI